MTTRCTRALPCAFGLFIAGSVASAGDDPFADTVVAYAPGTNPVPGFTNPAVALGQPERFTGEGINPMIVSVFNPPWRTDEVVSIGAGGSLVLQFDTPVTDDPDNPYGIDLIVFGNALLVDGNPQDGICPPNAQLIAEGGAIEVSADGVNWFAVPDVSADGMFPTAGWVDRADPYSTTAGTIETNVLLPVDPAIQLSDFNSASNDDILQMYRGAAGGAGIDIGALGLSEISFVRITNPPDALATPEIDAVADVAPRKAGDVTGDGVTDVFDLLALLADWGQAHPSGWRSEFTGDAVIDVFDLLLLLTNWGP